MVSSKENEEEEEYSSQEEMQDPTIVEDGSRIYLRDNYSLSDHESSSEEQPQRRKQSMGHKLVELSIRESSINKDTRYLEVQFRNESNFELPVGLSIMLLDSKNKFIAEYILKDALHAGEFVTAEFHIAKEKTFHPSGPFHFLTSYNCSKEKAVYFSEVIRLSAAT